MAADEQGRAAAAGLVDSHAHLDLLPDADEAVAEAEAAGVAHILAVGIDLESSRKAAAWAERYPRVHASAGIHPHGAASAGGIEFDRLAELARADAVVAVGETGLDYYRDGSPRDMQAASFRRHIRLARELELPLVVHSREAGTDTLAILGEEAGETTVILHCFAMTDKVEECAERGYFMSLAGNVTFRNAEALREAAARIPTHLILTETDAPYLAPDPWRGRENRPAYVGYVVEHVASLRGMDPEELTAAIAVNFRKAFRLP